MSINKPFIPENTCCFTGHRKMDLPTSIVKKRLETIIKHLAEHGVFYFCTGGALGFDTLAAEIVLKLKVLFPRIQLILILPCKDQNQRWSITDTEIYDTIKRQADQVLYACETYEPGCMHQRNRQLVDRSQYCICYLERPTGGTAYTVKYARKKGLMVFNLSDDQLHF